MRTTKQVIETSNIPAKLIRSVILQLGGTVDAREKFPDITNHGIDGGFHGFIYYSDTVAFFKRNRNEITQLVESYAEEFGTTPVEMVAEFNCLKSSSSYEKLETIHSIGRCLYGGRLTDEDDLVANALAWFAAEEVARAFCDE